MSAHDLATKAATLLALVSLSATLIPAARGGDDLNDWFCSTFSMPTLCKVLDVLGVLSPLHPDECGWARHGQEVRRFTIASKADELLWRCDGCSSPVPTSESSLAVLREGHIMLIDLGAPAEPPKSVVYDAAIVHLLRLLPDDPHRMVVICRTGTAKPSACIANLKTGHIEPWNKNLPAPPAIQSPCELQPLRSFHEASCSSVKAASLGDQKQAIILDRHAKAVCAGNKDEAWASDEQATSEMILPLPNPEHPSSSRFDPVWTADGSSVIYLARPHQEK